MVREVNLNHICKVEGHANLTLKIVENKVKKCELKANEGARFFEALVLGKKVEDVQEIVSRICGICSSAHSVASIQALESALKIKPDENQLRLRELLMIGERIRSNATHLYFLALPDYLGFSSAITMTKAHKEKIDNAIKLIQLGNKIIEVFGGREIHPFIKIKEEIKQNPDKIIDDLEDYQKIIRKTIGLFLNIPYPVLERESDYLSLKDKDYATIKGKIVSNSGKINIRDYKKHLKENIKEYATSKFVLKDSKPYMAGAMARILNNKEQLDNESKKYLNKNELSLKNPFFNNIAQALELLHLSKKAVKLAEKLEKQEKVSKFKIKKGHGVSAVEAPRGTLFHEYKINNNGKISYCNIIPPTTQNLNMMEIDIASHIENTLKKTKSKEKIVLEAEKIIRAYDPCFSCSTHFLKVNWL